MTIDHTLVAKWTKNISITYNVNSGTGTITATTGTINSPETSISLTITSSTPTRTGYTFKGWSTSSAATQSNYSGSGKIILSDSITLYAVWEGVTNTVTFNAGDGTSATTSMIVTYGQPYGLLPEANYTGYIFLGWYTAATGGTKIEPSTTVSITAAQTLYAQYEEDPNAGSGSGGSNVPMLVFDATTNGGTCDIESKELTLGGTYGELPIPTREFNGVQNVFKGWYTLPSGGEKITEDDLVLDTNSKLVYAQWISNIYEIVIGEYVRYVPTLTSYSQYYTGAGTQTYTPSSTTTWKVYSNNNGELTIINSSDIALALGGESGYDYATDTINELVSAYNNEIYASSIRSIKESDATYISEHTTLLDNTVWIPKISTYGSVSLGLDHRVHSMGKSGGIGANNLYEYSKYSSGNEYTEEFEVTHYVCPVVTLASNLCVASGAGTKSSPYILEFPATTYTLTYNANGGSGAPSTQSIETKTGSVTFTVSSTVPTKIGGAFLGWSTSSTATYVTYEDGDTITSSANITLYAVWDDVCCCCGSTSIYSTEYDKNFCKSCYRTYNICPVTLKCSTHSGSSCSTTYDEICGEELCKTHSSNSCSNCGYCYTHCKCDDKLYDNDDDYYCNCCSSYRDECSCWLVWCNSHGWECYDHYFSNDCSYYCSSCESWSDGYDCKCCECCGGIYSECSCYGIYYCDTCEAYYCETDPCSCE